MRKLSAFETISLDGYMADADGDSTWAHSDDAEWNQFVIANAQGGGVLIFGRITYELMIQFWPTPMATESMPKVAERMNGLEKIVFSRTLKKADWQNTRLVKTDLVAEIKKLKQQDGPDMAILGSGSIVAQLTTAGLIDEYQIALKPIILGAGRTMFEGVPNQPSLKRLEARSFANGNMFLRYAPS